MGEDTRDEAGRESVFLALVGARYEDGGHVLSAEDARVLTMRVMDALGNRGEVEAIGEQMAHALAVWDEAVWPMRVHWANGTNPTADECHYVGRAAEMGDTARRLWANRSTARAPREATASPAKEKP